MSIRFICGCGKHLRTRDEMGARRSVCPACGAPVGIPALQPSHAGDGLGPLSPDERRQLARQRAEESASAVRPGCVSAAAGGGPRQPPTEAQDEPLAARARRRAYPNLIRQVVTRAFSRRRRQWRFETHWYECLLYPCRAWPLVFLLAVGLSGATGCIALTLALPIEPESGPASPIYLFLALQLVVFGYTCGFLNGTLRAAAAGEANVIHWTAFDMRLILWSVASWLVCFLAGPVVPAVVALFYWIYCGDPELVDWLILVELLVVASGYWILALLAVSRHDRLRDAQPRRIAELASRLGGRAEAAVILTSALTMAHLWLFFATVRQLHRGPLAWLELTVVWIGALFAATFVFRLLGVWRFRCRA